MMPIKNAKDFSLEENPGTLPNVSDALLNWFQNVTFITIVSTIVNGQAVEVETPICFQGVVESVTGQALLMKPDGQRDWNWINVWALTGLVLRNDEIIKYLGTKYRVMKNNNWEKYGYVQYDLVEDYEK